MYTVIILYFLLLNQGVYTDFIPNKNRNAPVKFFCSPFNAKKLIVIKYLFLIISKLNQLWHC